MPDINNSNFFNRMNEYTTPKKHESIFNNAPAKISGTRFKKLPTPRVQYNYESSAALQKQLQNLSKQAAKIPNTEKIVLLKELLNIPQDIKDFLLMMTDKSQTQPKDVKQFLQALLGSNVDASKILSFLQANGKEANAKLFQMIVNLNQSGTSANAEELKKLTNLISAFVPTAAGSESQALKNILLLYLPWLPLTENTGFQLEFEGGEEEKQKGEEETVTILISTENFGNVKVLLSKMPGDNLEIQIACSKLFPKEEILKEFKKETDEYKLDMQIGFEENENLKPVELQKQEQQVSMNSNQKVNSFLLLMAHHVVKTVLGVDKDFSLRQKRKEMI